MFCRHGVLPAFGNTKPLDSYSCMNMFMFLTFHILSGVMLFHTFCNIRVINFSKFGSILRFMYIPWNQALKTKICQPVFLRPFHHSNSMRSPQAHILKKQRFPLKGKTCRIWGFTSSVEVHCSLQQGHSVLLREAHFQSLWAWVWLITILGK